MAYAPMGGSPNINESAYILVGVSHNSIINNDKIVEIWFVKDIITVDYKYCSFLYNILKYNRNIHHDTQNICQKLTYSFQTEIKSHYGDGSNVLKYGDGT